MLLPLLNSLSALGRAAHIFSPADVAGLRLWYEAQRITGLSNNDPVGQWNDLSSSGAHVIQTLGVSKPLYKLVGGKPEVWFDGSNDALSSSVTATFKHVFLLGRYDGAAFANYSGFFTGTDGSGNSAVLVGDQGFARFYNYGMPTSYRFNGTAYAASNMIAPMNAYGVCSFSNTDGWTCAPQFGLNRIYGQPLVGGIRALIAYQNVLTGNDLTNVENYLTRLL